MGKPKAQPVPDPTVTAAAQGAANKETAISQAELNMINQQTPMGSLNYQQIGTYSDGTPKFSASTALTPEGQRLQTSQTAFDQGTSDLANSQLGSINNNLATPFSYDGLPAAPKGDQQFLQSAGDAVYNQAKSRLDPQWDTNQRELETKLANQGITDPNSEAYKNAMRDFSMEKNDAFTSAQNNATANASSAAQALFGMGTTARSNAVTEALNQRELPINEAATLAGQSGAVGMPQFTNTPQTAVQPTDVLGAYNLSNSIGANNLNQQNAARSALIGALGQAGGSAAGLAVMHSDRRLKTAVEKVGRLTNGLNLYRFAYLWAPAVKHLGVMADEVLKVNPAAVIKMPSGYLAVDYEKALAW